MTTGAAYNHFENKSILFDALVQAPAEEMLERFAEIHRQMTEQLFPLTGEAMGQNASDGTDWMLDFIYEHLVI